MHRRPTAPTITTGCPNSATGRRRRTPEGDYVEETDWHDVRVFGEVAQRTHREVRKGTRVAQLGREARSRLKNLDRSDKNRFVPLLGRR